MFFDRDNPNRRQRQIAYRNQLKNQIEQNNSSKILSRSRGVYKNKGQLLSNSNSQNQTFSLLKNIQIQQQSRKNKQSEYYAELRNQIQKQKDQKKRKRQQKAQRERQQQQKVMRQNQILRQRAEIQKQNQKKKGKAPPGAVSDINNIQLNNSNNNAYSKRRQSSKPQFGLGGQKNNPYSYNSKNNIQSRLKTSQSNVDDNQKSSLRIGIQSFNNNNNNDFDNHRRSLFNNNNLPIYANRAENQSFNFLPQRRYMDSYFQQLLGQRRRFQQQASQISQLNKIFYQQKSRSSKIQSRGLQQLKKLQTILDQKGSNYMSGYELNRRKQRQNLNMNIQ